MGVVCFFAGENRAAANDNNGNLVQAINALGQCTVYGYTAANEPLSQTVYDNATGSSITDCDSNTSPVRTITYSYDDYGRYNGYSDGETTVAYDYEEGTDRLASVSTHFLSIWNNPGTVDDESKKTVQYRYEANGQLKELVNPEGRTYRYSYDAAGRVGGMSLGPDGRVDVDGYLWDKPVNITYRNSGGNEAANEAHTLDGFLRRKTASYTTPVSSEIELTYTYNPENHIKTITGNPQGNLTYDYDAADRLTSAVRAGQQTENENFSYDNAHNRTAYSPSPSGGEGAPSGAGEGSYSYSLNNNGLLDSITANTVTTSFTHDANGHRTHKTGADTWQYEYNAQERLQSIKKNNIEQATYAYNAQGQRIRKTANGTTTFYLYNPMGLAAEYSSEGTLQREYGYLPGQPYMTNPLFMRNSSGLYFYRNDHLGTPQQLVDGLGNLVWQARYNAFGKATIEVEMIENNLRLAGQYYDSESNLHQNWFRDYDPETGRYLQRDPIGLNGGVNTYAFVMGNPVIFIDLNGLCIYPRFADALAGAAGGFVTGGIMGLGTGTPAGALAGALLGAAYGGAGGAIGGALGDAVAGANDGPGGFVGGLAGSATKSAISHAVGGQKNSPTRPAAEVFGAAGGGMVGSLASQYLRQAPLAGAGLAGLAGGGVSAGVGALLDPLKCPPEKPKNHTDECNKP